ncbi:hypothetical protein [Streptomyces smaragdinus]|nr:hypothetical protein [Streptomyces smaragdinus]
MIGKRHLAEITEIRDNILYAVNDRGWELQHWDQGVLDTYEWSLGTRDHSPITHRPSTGHPSPTDLAREDDAAYEELRFGADPHRQTYANGVQHATMWLRGQTDSQPWSLWIRS